MSLKEKLEKIDFEIQNGLKFKASDRLRNLIQENPNETQLWNKLAELYNYLFEFTQIISNFTSWQKL